METLGKCLESVGNCMEKLGASWEKTGWRTETAGICDSGIDSDKEILAETMETVAANSATEVSCAE